MKTSPIYNQQKLLSIIYFKKESINISYNV